jgi:hypothetical protein
VWNDGGLWGVLHLVVLRFCPPRQARDSASIHLAFGETLGDHLSIYLAFGESLEDRANSVPFSPPERGMLPGPRVLRASAVYRGAVLSLSREPVALSKQLPKHLQTLNLPQILQMQLNVFYQLL